MTDGIKDKHRAAIVAAIAANDRVERAVLFGSRATGTNTVTSDVDIALFGDRLTLTDQARLAATLDEIPMAQSVDLLLYNSIQSQKLREHIRRQGVEWPLPTRSESTATFREVSEFTIGGGWGQDTEFDDSVPVRVIRGTDFDRIRSGEFSRIPARYEQHSKVQRRLLKPGDILLEISGGSRTSNQSTGRSCFITDRALAQLGKKVIPASFCRLVRVDQAVIDPRLAYYALQEMYVSGRAVLYEQQSTGISNFQFEYFLDSEVFRLPPLSEQRAIAHILGTLDDKIELNRRMNATLEGMAQALFRSWFVDFDPVRAKMEGRDTGLPKDIADLFPDRLVDSKLGEIPEGWPLLPLPELVEVNPPRQLRKGEAAPYLNMANMPTRGHAPNSVARRPFGSGIRFANGDTLVARITPCLENGKTAYVDFLRDDDIGWGSTEYIVMRPKHPLPSEFAYLLARSGRFRDFAIQNMSGTSGRQRVPASSLWGFEVPSPSASVGVEFGRVVRLLFGRARSAVDESRSLAVLRDTLLPKLVSGELRVPGQGPAGGHEDHPATIGAHEA